jgi:ABC-type lipoprotein release transport system permease subunit
VRLFGLAVRNFWRHRQRYQVLFTLVVLGAALSLVLLAVTASLTQSLRLKAGQYFGGDVSVLGYSDGVHRISDDAVVADVLKTSGVPSDRLFRRTVSYNSETILFHKDQSLKQRRMIGVDPGWEKASLGDFDWDAGGPAGLVAGDGLVVSRGTADKLRVEVGDAVTLLIDTFTGSKNTISLRISGIFHDTSFFGYSSYLSIETLNRALGLPPGTSTEMGLSLASPLDAGRAAEALHQALSRRVPVVPLLRSKSDLDALQDGAVGTGVRYAVMTLDARLAQIQQILDALLAVSAVLNGLFLLIVVLGVGNTFRAVLVERTREIGVWRALGMVRSRLVLVVLAEVAVLAAAGGVVGLAAGTLVWTGLTLVPWGNQALAAMFLIRGHLAWTLPWAQELGLFLVMILAGVAGALGPALRSAHWKPVDALRYHA